VRDRWWLEQLRTVTPLTAGVTVRDSMVLLRGRRRIEVAFLGRANTRGDLVVYLPEERIVATGDVVVHPMPYGFGSYLGAWIEVLDRVRGLGATTIVPGHGSVLRDWSYLDQLRELMVAILEQARDAVRKGYDLAATRRSVSIDSLRARFTGGDSLRARVFDANFTTPAVERAWLEARGDLDK
jgi:glyoxylase-like metal-dependent hydrolase (beta-lactamase superfamily II)